MKDFVAGIVVILVIMGLLALIVSIPKNNQTMTSSPVNSTEATLSDRLEFPEGWHLAEAYSYAFQYTGLYVVYICVNTEQTEYRICTPKVSASE